MTSGNSNGDERRDARRSSGATRRIIVEDPQPEDLPRARGRKLATPIDLDSEARSRRVGAGSVPKQEAPTRSNRITATGNAVQTAPAKTARQSVRSGSVVDKNSSKRANTGVNVRKLILITGGMVGFLVVATAVLLLLPSPAKKKPAGPSQPAVSAASPTSESPTPESAASIQPSPSQVNGSAAQPIIETAPPIAASPTVEAADIRSMSVQLASQISQKSGYEFGPEFVERIRDRTREYVSPRALSLASQYRREINKSFRDQGLNPLVGYALAMSRSKFDPATTEKGVGIWQVPTSVARSHGYVGSLKIPEASAQITASYTKQLLSTFDAEDFMYAIACFGMNLQDAGRLQARLVSAAPDSRNRRDIMKMIRAGVLTPVQVDNIARFFAAGIVGENPQKFGLVDSQPFSSLY